MQFAQRLGVEDDHTPHPSRTHPAGRVGGKQSQMVPKHTWRVVFIDFKTRPRTFALLSCASRIIRSIKTIIQDGQPEVTLAFLFRAVFVLNLYTIYQPEVLLLFVSKCGTQCPNCL